MSEIYSKLYDFLEIGDDFPTLIMGVINLSPESFYKSSIYNNLNELEKVSIDMIKNGAKMLDIGARSTAPWSEKITINEEMNRIVPSIELISKIIPKNIIISIDTQYKAIAERAYDITQKFNKKILINDVSCLKTDPALEDFIVEKNIPVTLMASKKIPGDLLTIEEISNELNKTIKKLKNKGLNEQNIIVDPGIGRWIEKKIHTYDLKIISNLYKLKSLQKPILVSISRKSFIGTTLNLPDPQDRLNGTLSATAVAVFNGANIIRTHDVNKQLLEIIKMAEEIRINK